MAEMKRQKNVTWYPPNTWDHVPLQVLMDIRDELQALNHVMQCSNVARGFQALAKIARRDERAFKRRVEHAVAKRIKRAAAA
jgi:hypothetical protein